MPSSLDQSFEVCTGRRLWRDSKDCSPPPNRSQEDTPAMLRSLMGFPIRADKVTCAGLVGILMVLPNTIWKGPDARVQPVAKPRKIEWNVDSARRGVKLGKMTR